MRSFVSTVMLAFLLANSTSGQTIDLTVDQTQSSLTIGVLGISDTSEVIGDGSIELAPASEPFSEAQLSSLSLTAVDGFSINILIFVNISSAPGSAMVNMLNPGPTGNVDANNQFTQLGNLVQFLGVIDVSDPFNLAGGSMTVDLSTTDPVLLDLQNIQLSTAGDTLTVSSSIDVEIDLNGFAVSTTGTVVLTGDLPEFLLGDVNQDGTVDLLDVNPFVELLSNSLFQLEADINMDGEVNLLDIAGFVDLLAGA